MSNASEMRSLMSLLVDDERVERKLSGRSKLLNESSLGYNQTLDLFELDASDIYFQELLNKNVVIVTDSGEQKNYPEGQAPKIFHVIEKKDASANAGIMNKIKEIGNAILNPGISKDSGNYVDFFKTDNTISKESYEAYLILGDDKYYKADVYVVNTREDEGNVIDAFKTLYFAMNVVAVSASEAETAKAKSQPIKGSGKKTAKAVSTIVSSEAAKIIEAQRFEAELKKIEDNKAKALNNIQIAIDKDTASLEQLKKQKESQKVAKKREHLEKRLAANKEHLGKMSKVLSDMQDNMNDAKLSLFKFANRIAQGGARVIDTFTRGLSDVISNMFDIINFAASLILMPLNTLGALGRWVVGRFFPIMAKAFKGLGLFLAGIIEQTIEALLYSAETIFQGIRRVNTALGNKTMALKREVDAERKKSGLDGIMGTSVSSVISESARFKRHTVLEDLSFELNSLILTLK